MGWTRYWSYTPVHSPNTWPDMSGQDIHASNTRGPVACSVIDWIELCIQKHSIRSLPHGTLATSFLYKHVMSACQRWLSTVTIRLFLFSSKCWFKYLIFSFFLFKLYIIEALKTILLVQFVSCNVKICKGGGGLVQSAAKLRLSQICIIWWSLTL